MNAKSIRLIHQGQFLSYYEIDYTDDCGHDKTYEMVSRAGGKHKGSAPMLTLDTVGNELNAIVMFVFNEDQSKVLICKEFRMGTNHWVINNPAGLIDPGETAEVAAKRELFEETGLNLVEVIDTLNPSFTCSGITDELTTLIICKATGEIRGSDSVYEDIHSEWMDKEQVKGLLNDKNIVMASRTQAMLYMWSNS